LTIGSIAPAATYAEFPWTLVVGASIGLFILIAAGGTFLWLRGKSKSEEDGREKPPSSPIDVLRERTEILERLMIEGDTPALFERVARDLRTLLKERENESFDRMTSTQIVDRLENREASREKIHRTQHLLDLCDQVRFAGRRPTREECEDAIRNWRALLEMSDDRPATDGTPQPTAS
jgi:hypothetical protein